MCTCAPEPDQTIAIQDADGNTGNNERPLPQRNLGLPDVDDTSMNYVFTYVEFYQQDLFWSFLSDSFFVVGGILYIILCLWDVLPVDAEGTVDNHVYNVICALAPFVYVLNSLVDVQWASHVQQRNKIRRRMTKQWSESLVELFSPLSFAERESDTKESSLLWCRRLRRHTAHRRSLWAALTFGVAASLGFLAVLYSENDDQMKSASAHVYVISAIIALTGKRTRPWLAVSTVVNNSSSQYTYGSARISAFFNSPGALEDVGDLLFLFGSLVDSTLVAFKFEQPILSMFSAILWFVDACFYLQADRVMAKQAKQETLQRSDQVLV